MRFILTLGTITLLLSGCYKTTEITNGSTPGSYFISTFAGNGNAGFYGDGKSATLAALNNANSVTADNNGNVYIADVNNNRIRIVDAAGVINTFAGNGTVGFYGDGGIALEASFNQPTTIAFDNKGNAYITDFGNNRVRKVNAQGIVTTIAGTGSAGAEGDGGYATNASLNGPTGVSVDANGNVFFADKYNNVVRKIDTLGVIRLFAGSYISGYTGDNGAATSAKLNNPMSTSVDNNGNLYIADYNNNKIRVVDAFGTIRIFAGTGQFGYTGDGAAATLATLNQPIRIAWSKEGDLIVADNGNYRIRAVNFTTGIISTIGGCGMTGTDTGDGGPATNATISDPRGVAIDNDGNVFVAEYSTSVVRKIGLKH